jgi:subtilisin family serine protease
MSLPTDTNFAEQWHLHNTAVGQYDLDVVKVWNDYTGAGVKVFVFDNGFDYNNPDLLPNYDQDHDHDYGNNDDDAAPFYSDDDHGTAVAGIIGAARNGTGVVGIAYDSSLTGFRIDFTVSNNTWAATFVSMLADTVTDGGDVVNMSFGGAGSFDTFDGATNVASMKAAIATAVADGRDGLGLILVKAAGNDREDAYNHNNGLAIDVNHNSMDSDSRQIIVAGVDRDGFVSYYSSYGAPILISAFGSPFEIVTTDRTGADGYNTDPADPGVTTTFAGTSAATPMISGVVALMLQANPDLGWRDVQSILAYSARHVGSAVDGTTMAHSELNTWNWNAAGNWNGGGLHYNQDYGYGLVDALAAVRLAESWQAGATSANEKSAVIHVLDNTSTVIADGNTTGTEFTGDTTKAIDVERVTVDVTLSAAQAADIEVWVTSPDGIEQRLIAGQYAYGTSFSGTLHLNCQAFHGESSQGTWKVRVVDAASGNALSVSDIVVTAYGSATSTNESYVYTNEFSDFAGVGGHSNNLIDKDGGTDMLNASAVTAAMTVDLSAGTGTIDGVAMKIKGIEDVSGGDGDDHLTGNGSANALSGGRGRDVLAGGKGSDSFVYHVVSDSLDGKKHDVVKDFITGDHIDLSDIDTKAAVGDQGFKFVGSKAFDGGKAELDFHLTDNKGTAHDFTTVFADLDGDKHADFQIQLSGLHTLAKSDFLL